MYSVLQYECNSGEGYWLRYLDFEQSMRFQVSMLASACRCSVSFCLRECLREGCLWLTRAFQLSEPGYCFLLFGRLLKA
jgi:hypothetical protein